MTIFIAIVFAFLNRARGSKLFEKTTSTAVARLASTLAMAVVVTLMAGPHHSFRPILAWAWASLFLALLFGWGKYAGAAVGSGRKDETEFAPVDWLMQFLPIKNDRIWGAVAMGLRLSLLAPSLLGLAFLTDGAYWPALFTPLMGLGYLAGGYALGPGKGWMFGEYCTGAILGVLLCLTLG
jgi:hypothetical protein